MYLALGPWFLAQFQGGEPLGVFWPGWLGLQPSLLSGLRPGEQLWHGLRLFRTADAFLLPTVHMVIPDLCWSV